MRFEKRNFYYFVNFYKSYPDFVQTLSAKSNILSWSHYLVLLQVPSKEARDWYEQEALIGLWSVRTLQRNVSSDYYHRMLMSQKKDLVKEEVPEWCLFLWRLIKGFNKTRSEFLKNALKTRSEFLKFWKVTQEYFLIFVLM